MESSRSSPVTQLPEKSEPGDGPAAGRFFADVYSELQGIAGRFLQRERKDHVLQPAALVHEAYLKLVGQTGVDWKCRDHLLAIAADAMREILVDHARHRHAIKRGGNRCRVALDDNLAIEPVREVDQSALDSALTKLARIAPCQFQMIELRFFRGLGVAEAAKMMGMSKRSMEREWTKVRAWLRQELGGSGATSEDAADGNISG